LLAGTLAQTLLFGAGSISPEKDKAGPVELVSPTLHLPGRVTPMPAGWNGEARALLYEWRDRETHQLLGPARVAVLWSTGPEREWMQAGSACDFILRHFGRSDAVTAIGGMDALTEPVRGIHTCNALALADQRPWVYAYQLPDARCRTSALVFWRIPGTPADGTDDERFNTAKSRAFQAIGGSIVPDAACIATTGSLARAMVAALVAGMASVLLLFSILYRRSA
jgi:hypothetical protein